MFTAKKKKPKNLRKFKNQTRLRQLCYKLSNIFSFVLAKHFCKKLLFQINKQMKWSFVVLPLLVGYSHSTQSSPQPAFLFACQFDVFFFFTSPDHTVNTTDSDQREASKLEQETRAKGVFTLSTSPLLLISQDFSSNSSGCRVLHEATSTLARPQPLHLSFYCISLRQFSAECQGQVTVPKKRRKKKREERENKPKGL